MKKVFGTFFLLFLSQICLAQAGSLDNSFGNHGLVRTNIIGFKAANDISKIFPMQDGSFYLVVNVGTAAYVVHRFQNGAMDYNYGNSGYSDPVIMSPSTAARQPDGKIVIGGTMSPGWGTTDFCVGRLNTNGKLDSSFSGDGILNTDFFSLQDNVQAMAIQPDGKIIAAGTCMTTFPYTSFAVARYNPDGSLDNSFSGDGKQNIDFGGSVSKIKSILIQPDGKIVTAGQADAAMGIARFLVDGSLDNTFGSGGKTTVTGGITAMSCTAIALQTDGKLVLTGYGSAPNHFHEDVALARLKSNGIRDSSFSATGLRFADMGTSDNAAVALVIQNDGRIIVGGTTRVGSAYPQYALMRFLPDGTTDLSYSGDGIQLTRIGDVVDFLTTMDLQPDGKLLAAGWSYLNGKQLYSAARYDTNGNLDPSFDADGVLIDGIPLGSTHFYGSVIQPDGKIIAVGYTQTELNNDFAIARYNTDGTLDNSFSDDGILTLSFGQGDDRATAVALQPDGKIVVAGTAYDGTTNDFAVTRLNPDGTIDNSFSGDGKLLFDFYGLNDEAKSLAIQQDGKILVGGYTADTVQYGLSMNVNFTLARFNSDGSLDNNFGDHGKVVTDFGYAEYGNTIMLQPDGKIVMAGTLRWDFTSAYASDFALARFNPDGGIDVSFGNGGKIRTDFFGGGDYLYGATIQSDGKVIAVGSSNPTYAEDVVVARYKSDGTLDSSFSDDGLLVLDLVTTTEQAKSVAVQPNGKIILGAAVDLVDYDFSIARLNPNGTLDNSFSGDGSVVVDFGYGFDYLENINLRNNRIYAVGSSDFVTTQGAVAAFLIDDSAGSSITCPKNKVSNTDPWICSAVVNNIDPSVLPGNAAVSYVLTGATNLSGNGFASGLKFETGITNVTYKMVNDPTQTCQFTVTIKDNELPRAEYPFLQNICYNNSHSYTLPPLQIMDNCGLSRVDFKISGATNRVGTGTDPSGHLNIGTNAIDWIVTDNSGNAIKLYTLVKVDGQLSVTIPDAYALYPWMDANTVYLGYNPAAYITLHAQAYVSTGFSYATEWSDGFRANWNTVHPTAQTTYSVTITDLAGCKATANKIIKVVDVRCGDQNSKVLVCRSAANTACVDWWNVDNYLRQGASLGSCPTELLTSTPKNVSPKTETANTWEVYPNPSQQEFKLKFYADRNEMCELIIRDQIGQIVEQLRIKSNQQIVIGRNYRPGIYFAELQLENKKYTTKLIKQ